MENIADKGLNVGGEVAGLSHFGNDHGFLVANHLLPFYHWCLAISVQGNLYEVGREGDKNILGGLTGRLRGRDSRIGDSRCFRSRD